MLDIISQKKPTAPYSQPLLHQPNMVAPVTGVSGTALGSSIILKDKLLVEVGPNWFCTQFITVFMTYLIQAWLWASTLDSHVELNASVHSA